MKITILNLIFMLILSIPVYAVPASLEYDDSELIQFNLPRGSTWWMSVHKIPFYPDGAVTGIKYSPDGNTLIVSTDCGQLTGFAINTGKTLWQVETNEHNFETYVLDISPDGKFFLTSQVLSRAVDSDGSLENRLAPPLEIRKTSDGTIFKTVKGFSRFYHYHYDSDTKQIYDSSDYRKTGANIDWFNESGSLLFSMIADSAQYMPDGKSILIHWCNARADCELVDQQYQLVDASSLKEVWFWQVIGDRIDMCGTGTQNAKITSGIFYAPLVYAKNQDRFIFGSPDLEVRSLSLPIIQKNMKIENIHDMVPPDLIYAIKVEANSQISSISLSPDGKYGLATVYLDGVEHLELINLETKKRVFKTPRINNVYQGEIAPDGNHVIAAGGQLIVWNEKGIMAGDWSQFGGGFPFDMHPVKREIAAFARGNIFLLSERVAVKVNLKSGKFNSTNLYMKDGIDIVVSGQGILNFQSGSVVIDSDYENIIEGYTSTSDELYDFSDAERWGEIKIKPGSDQAITVYGGLSKEEYNSVKVMRENFPAW